MKQKSTDVSNPNTLIDTVLGGTYQISSLVAEEIRPQLIVLTFVYIAFLIIVPSSKLSDGIKILIFSSTSAVLLWLTFYILPKQVQGVQDIQKKLKKVKDDKTALESTQTNLEKQLTDSRHDLSDTVGKSRAYLENIEDRLESLKEKVQEEDARNELLSIQNYIDEKKREFDSTISRIQIGGRMIDTKKAAARDLDERFTASKQYNSKTY